LLLGEALTRVVTRETCETFETSYSGDMKVIFLGLLTILLLAAAPLSAQTNTNQTIQELKANAEKGDAKAQLGLGLVYFIGDSLTKDYAESAKWVRKAAEQNLVLAQNTLGQYYTQGIGVAKD
jgi:TPR repeat protein